MPEPRRVVLDDFSRRLGLAEIAKPSRRQVEEAIAEIPDGSWGISPAALLVELEARLDGARPFA